VRRSRTRSASSSSPAISRLARLSDRPRLRKAEGPASRGRHPGLPAPRQSRFRKPDHPPAHAAAQCQRLFSPQRRDLPVAASQYRSSRPALPAARRHRNLVPVAGNSRVAEGGRNTRRVREASLGPLDDGFEPATPRPERGTLPFVMILQHSGSTQTIGAAGACLPLAT
jgi:hypothetical protein